MLEHIDRCGGLSIFPQASSQVHHAAIETIVSREDFAASITEAQKLAQPEDFDFLYRIGEVSPLRA